MKNRQYLLIAFMLGLVAFLAGACIKPPEAGSTPGAATPAATETPAASATVSNTAEVTTTATMTSEAAMATVNIASLRVRAQPNATSAVVAGIKQGETYKVIGLSSDGLWVELEIPKAQGGRGWVSANFVTIKGSITNTNITTVTPTATEAVTATAMVTSTEMATPSMTATPEVSATMEMTATPAVTAPSAVTTTTSATSTMVITTTASGIATINTAGARLRVRSEPRADAPVVGYVYNGEKYQILGTSSDNKWIQIAGSTAGRGENPKGGWVAAQFVVISR